MRLCFLGQFSIKALQKSCPLGLKADIQAIRPSQGCPRLTLTEFIRGLCWAFNVLHPDLILLKMGRTAQKSWATAQVRTRGVTAPSLSNSQLKGSAGWR